DAAAAEGRVLKFVPASGAATRMFKDLVAAWQNDQTPSATPAVREFFERLDAFPFAEDIRRRAGLAGPPATPDDERQILRALFEDLRLADLPKALVPFHRATRIRTAFEEHLLEATKYARDARGICRLHFTVPVEAHALFEETLTRLRPQVE